MRICGNPTNPDPTEHVTWGDQTWQEMLEAAARVGLNRAPRRPKRLASSLQRGSIRSSGMLA